jgi:energy-coupling factor transporter ATP-binding protein EcfA2
VITRIEIDGFKSFVDFELELKPFTVLAGANNSGKSNLLDAIALVEAANVEGLPAFTRWRPDGRSRGGRLFHAAADGARRDSFRVKVQTERRLVEMEVGTGEHGFEMSTQVTGDPNHTAVDVDAVMGAKPLAALLETRALDPTPREMRLGADIYDSSPLARSGENLAAVVGRIQESETFPDFRIDASYVLGELTDVRAVRDERRRVWDLELEMRGGRVFTPGEVSDGTLRVLCLLAAVHDPLGNGTLLIEEIENGLDPRYLGRLVAQLVKRSQQVGMVQVIATTHSPVIVGEAKRLSPESVYLFGIASGPREYDGERKLDYFTHARSVVPGGERGTFVPSIELSRYLTPVDES